MLVNCIKCIEKRWKEPRCSSDDSDSDNDGDDDDVDEYMDNIAINWRKCLKDEIHIQYSRSSPLKDNHVWHLMQDVDTGSLLVRSIFILSAFAYC